MLPSPIRTVLIEDERLARTELKRQLGHLPRIDLVGEAATFESAQALLRDVRPQLAFMDVQLDGGSGLELLAAAPVGMQSIIVSAYEAYALRGFDVGAVDYLLKPVQAERLRAAVARVAPPSVETSGDPSPVQPLDYADHLFLPQGEDGALFLPVSNIRAVVADGDYTLVQTGDGRTHKVLKPLKHWEARLPIQSFARIHRSAIVNVHSVRRIDRWFNRRYRVFVEGLPRSLIMSRRYADDLRTRLG